MTTTVRATASFLVVASAGAVVADLFGLTEVGGSSAYVLAVTALLAFGLYNSTRAIDLAEFRSGFRTVVLAVTFGVLLKVALIAGLLFLVFADPAYLVLAVAMAQIDPIAVAAIRAKSPMSASARTLLTAWASFDDPITALLAVYAVTFVQGATGHGPAAGGSLGPELSSFAVSLVWNLAAAGVAFMLWRARRALGRHEGRLPNAVRGTAVHVMGFLVLLVAVVAVAQSLFLALALLGLFCRPKFGAVLDRATQPVLLLAVFALGLVLADGVSLVPGLVLGVATYCAQVVVASTLPLRQSRRDRVRLALAQQNGLTAIVLALMLEPQFPGSVAIVAPAILVVNVLHSVCNGVWDRCDGPPAEKRRPAGLTFATRERRLAGRVG